MALTTIEVVARTMLEDGGDSSSCGGGGGKGSSGDHGRGEKAIEGFRLKTSVFI